MEAREVVRERKLARQPWEAALTARMRDLEGRQTGDYRRGWPRFHAPSVGRKDTLRYAASMGASLIAFCCINWCL